MVNRVYTQRFILIETGGLNCISLIYQVRISVVYSPSINDNRLIVEPHGRFYTHTKTHMRIEMLSKLLVPI